MRWPRRWSGLLTTFRYQALKSLLHSDFLRQKYWCTDFPERASGAPAPHPQGVVRVFLFQGSKFSNVFCTVTLQTLSLPLPLPPSLPLALSPPGITRSAHGELVPQMARNGQFYFILFSPFFLCVSDGA